MGKLAVTKYEHETSLPQLFGQLDHSARDTARVQLLIKISSIYYRKNNGLDSCVFFAKKARELSTALHFQEGSNEALFLECKAFIDYNDPVSARAILPLAYGEELIRLLLVVSEHYTYQDGMTAPDLDKAGEFLLRARKVCDSVHSKKWLYECLMFSGKYEFIRGNFDEGVKMITRIIEDCKKSADTAGEAHYWSELGRYLPETDSTFSEKIKSHQTAYDLFMKIGQAKDAIYELRDVAALNEKNGRKDTAEKQIRQVFAMLNTYQITPTYTSYLLSSEIHLQNGKYNKALTDLYKANSMLTPQEETRQIEVYSIMAIIYDGMGDTKKALLYYKKVLDYCSEIGMREKYIECYNVISCYLKLDDPKTAYDTLLNFKKKNQPERTDDKAIMTLASGKVYDALKDYRKAEQFYLETIELDKKMIPEGKREITQAPSPVYGYGTLGDFYIKRKRFREAKPYLLQALSLKNHLQAELMNTTLTLQEADIEYMLYKIDSADGDYRSALGHYAKNTILKDSMFNVAKNRALEELQVQYETKENMQTISLLQVQSQNKDAVMQKLGWQRNFTLGAIAMIIIIAGLLYNGYRRKQKSNRQLQIKQTEINQQNTALQQLVNDKDGLLKEKEWLLKEVHHRVKNNLQMMISLINIQSGYLTNEQAVEAIRNSSRRMYAMSLIHQKIYQSDNLSSISMKVYITELADYLKESFDPEDRIGYTIQTIPLDLDIIQAVPLGLIMNEVITNAIKYAFPNKPKGEIKITLSEKEKDRYILCISDNGVGLPAGFDHSGQHSLGMMLIHGLTQQIQGECDIRSNADGTTISITFEPPAAL